MQNKMYLMSNDILIISREIFRINNRNLDEIILEEFSDLIKKNLLNIFPFDSYNF